MYKERLCISLKKSYDFLPTVLDRKRIDYWYKSVDKESFKMSRKMIKREGLLCGGSCGGATYCAIEAIKKFNVKEGQNVVVILPDSIRNYMTKYLSDDWMIARGFLDVEPAKSDPWWFHHPISNLKESLTPLDNNVISENSTCAEALNIMKAKAIDCMITFNQG
jgi:cystathionine beta-synthase